MIHALACALLAVAAPVDPPDDWAAPPPSSETFEYVVDLKSLDDVVNLMWSDARPQKVEFLDWPRAGGTRGFNLSKLDAATRAQLKVPEDRGLVAGGLEESSPAWQAGLRNDDVLLSLNEEPLAQPEDLEHLLKEAGERPATLALIRKARPTSIQVQARLRAELGPVASPPPGFWIGVSVSAVAPTLRAQLDIPDDRGLAVTDLVDGSPAAAAGLQTGDVVLTVDGSPIADPLPLRACVSRSEGKPLTLEFLREGEAKSLKVTPIRRADASEELLDAEFRMGFIDIARSGAILRELGAAQPQPAGAQPAPTAGDDPKLDALAADLRALHDAVESLRKAMDEKK